MQLYCTEAFKLLCNTTPDECQCVAVVDSQTGSLVDCISEKDMFGIDPETFTIRFLWNECTFFKTQVRQGYDQVRQHGQDFASVPVSPICVRDSTPITAALHLLASHGIHQVFIRDRASKKPVGCLTQADVLKWLAMMPQMLADA